MDDVERRGVGGLGSVGLDIAEQELADARMLVEHALQITAGDTVGGVIDLHDDTMRGTIPGLTA
ncbi:hypothetical protein GCM10022268_28420 [Sphingomonas cynarae]|uniref:Uncharacterized protein n=1 Tax=Sphingomonas cynarae TaxID=930197 RepID=A0ABP7EF90_9SPHN